MAKKYLVIGQSNAARLFTVYADTPSEADVTVSSDGTTWAAPTTAGAVALLDALHAALGEPIAALNCGVGGTCLTVEGSDKIFAEEANIIQYWLNEAATYRGESNTCYPVMLTKAAGNTFDGVIWLQGEADAHADYTDLYDIYGAGLTTLWDRLKSDLTFTPGAKFILFGTGRSTQGYGDDQSWTDVRQAQRWWCESTPDAVYAGHAVDLPLDSSEVNAVHWTAAGYTSAGQRIAQAILCDLGEISYYSVPPSVAAWSQSGTYVDVRLAHGAGAAFTPATGITGFSALDSGGNALTISSAAFLTGRTVRLTMVDATTVAKLRHLHGAAPDVTGIVVDDTALALPLDIHAAESDYSDLTLLLLGPSDLTFDVALIHDGDAAFGLSVAFTAEGFKGVNGAASFDVSAGIDTAGNKGASGGAVFNVGIGFDSTGRKSASGGAAFGISASLSATGSGDISAPQGFSGSAAFGVRVSLNAAGYKSTGDAASGGGTFGMSVTLNAVGHIGKPETYRARIAASVSATVPEGATLSSTTAPGGSVTCQR